MNGARRHVHLRQYLFDGTRKGATRIGINGDSSSVARLQSPNVVLEYLRIDPHPRKIGDGVEPRRWLDVEIRQRVAFGDVPRNWRVESEIGNWLAFLL